MADGHAPGGASGDGRDAGRAPRVTAVIPTFNRSATLHEAVDSVLAQTYRDVEVLVVDDGSTDGTGDALAARYAGRPEVRCIRRDNGGPAAARNTGILQARGDLVAFLDSDDLWLPEKLRLQVDGMDDRPEAAMSFTDAVGSGPGEEARSWFSRKGYRGDTSLRGLVEASVPIRTPCVIARKGVLLELGGFDESFLCAEDTDLWIRIASRHPIVCLDRPLTIVRRQPDSIRSERALERWRCGVRIWEKHEAALLSSGCPPELIARRAAHAHRSLARICRGLGDYRQAGIHYLRSWRRRPARLGALLWWAALAPLGAFGGRPARPAGAARR